MIRFKIMRLTHLALATTLSLTFGTHAHAQTTCGEICTSDFWDTATTVKISEAIATVGVDARDEFGLTPLHRAAAAAGPPENVITLLEAGADLSAGDRYGSTPLHWAAVAGTHENVLALLEAGADVNARNAIGVTPLHWAAVAETPENILTLLEAGADVNARNAIGVTPLRVAAKYGPPKNVMALLVAGADAAITDDRGLTPWDLANDNDQLKGTDAYWALNDARFK
jgi:ankyrin repeat protein